jgi:hypothetical protein
VRVAIDEHELRNAWIRFCAETSDRYTKAKDAQASLDVIAARYAGLSSAEREVVDRLLIEQLTPQEPVPGDPWYLGENARFDALFLVDRFAIVSVVPTLRRLAEWLQDQTTPGAPYEWTKVNRILGSLATP